MSQQNNEGEVVAREEGRAYKKVGARGRPREVTRELREESSAGVGRAATSKGEKMQREIRIIRKKI